MPLNVVDPQIKTPTILTKDSNDQCLALQPTDYLSPALDLLDISYTPRGFTLLSSLPTGEDCE